MVDGGPAAAPDGRVGRHRVAHAGISTEKRWSGQMGGARHVLGVEQHNVVQVVVAIGAAWWNIKATNSALLRLGRVWAGRRAPKMQ